MRKITFFMSLFTVLGLLLQVLLVVRLLRSSNSSLEKQAEEQTRQLDKQLDSLKIGHAKLRDLDAQLKASLKVLARPQEEDTSGGANALHAGVAGTVFPSGNEDGECVGGPHRDAASAVAAVVSITFNRVAYLQRHLDSLLAIHGSDPANRHKFPLFVSQDGATPNPAVAELARGLTGRGVSYLHHRETKAPTPLLNRRENLAYYRISNHYKFIMRTFFDCLGYSKLIILEDDMELAPDFFPYFEATGRLLASDPTLYCISSWNDHGQAKFVRDERQLYRSDFFPGLGWMLTKAMWMEARGEWPKAYWDDWMRLNTTRKGRQCIRPEVCRTYNFGAKGSSKGQYYKRFLAPIRLSSSRIDWAAEDLAYLEKSRYDKELEAALGAAKAVETVDEARQVDGDAVIFYSSQEQYERLTERSGMLREWKDGVPRGGYKGVVVVRWDNARLFFAPAKDFVAPEKTEAVQKLDQSGAVVRKKIPDS